MIGMNYENILLLLATEKLVGDKTRNSFRLGC